MQVGVARTATSMARRQSISCLKASARQVLLNSAEIAMIGTTGSGPSTGTSTSGISAPVP